MMMSSVQTTLPVAQTSVFDCVDACSEVGTTWVSRWIHHQWPEWYPQARDVGTSIDWGRLKIIPGAAVNLPVDYKDSHYYPARETDAAPVQVCGLNGKPAQQEKFSSIAV